MRCTDEDGIDPDAASPREIGDRVVTDHPYRPWRRDRSRRLEQARVWLLETNCGRRDRRVEPARESESLHQGREFRHVIRDDHVSPAAIPQKREHRFDVVEDPVPVRIEDAFPQSTKRAGEVGMTPAESDIRIGKAVFDGVPPRFRRC